MPRLLLASGPTNPRAQSAAKRPSRERLGSVGPASGTAGAWIEGARENPDATSRTTRHMSAFWIFHQANTPRFWTKARSNTKMANDWQFCQQTIFSNPVAGRNGRNPHAPHPDARPLRPRTPRRPARHRSSSAASARPLDPAADLRARVSGRRAWRHRAAPIAQVSPRAQRLTRQSR